MIKAMDLKNLSPHTKRHYLAAVTGLAKHYRQSPEKITDQMIEDYLLYLKNEKSNAPVILSKNRFTIFSASNLDSWFDSFSAWMRSGLFIRSKLLWWIDTILKSYRW
jgi:hypothetical protein